MARGSGRLAASRTKIWEVLEADRPLSGPTCPPDRGVAPLQPLPRTHREALTGGLNSSSEPINQGRATQTPAKPHLEQGLFQRGAILQSMLPPRVTSHFFIRYSVAAMVEGFAAGRSGPRTLAARAARNRAWARYQAGSLPPDVYVAQPSAHEDASTVEALNVELAWRSPGRGWDPHVGPI